MATTIIVPMVERSLRRERLIFMVKASTSLPHKSFMKTSRRHFLTAAGAASLPFVFSRPAWAAAPGALFNDTLGLQLWTVRNQMKKNAQGTLKAVKAAGYHQVEMGNVTSEKETFKIAKDLGLEVTSAFMDWTALGKNNQEPNFAPSLETAVEMKLKYLVFGYIGKGHRESVENYQQISERLNKAGIEAKEAGVELCYHNHSFEYAPLGDSGKCGYDVLIDEMDPEAWKMELDVFWAKLGGWDPVETLKGKLNGKVSQLHLKDLKADVATEYDEGKVPKDAFQECGDGTINMAAVCEAGKTAGVKQAHVEQDQSPNPLQSIDESFRYLTAKS